MENLKEIRTTDITSNVITITTNRKYVTKTDVNNLIGIAGHKEDHI